jgi:hypothetical protein
MAPSHSHSCCWASVAGTCSALSFQRDSSAAGVGGLRGVCDLRVAVCCGGTAGGRAAMMARRRLRALSRHIRCGRQPVDWAAVVPLPCAHLASHLPPPLPTVADYLERLALPRHAWAPTTAPEGGGCSGGSGTGAGWCPPRSVSTLRTLHRAHQLRVAFENLDIYPGAPRRPIVL